MADGSEGLADDGADLPALPELLGDSQAMVGFLKSALAELEAASGAEDPEARALLLQLREQTAVLQQAASDGSSTGTASVCLNELEIAAHLDR
jgi:hypothetical protein